MKNFRFSGLKFNKNMDEHATEGNNSSGANTEIESSVNLIFQPPVYIQRYLAVQNVLNDSRWKNSISKIIDFGCSEFKLFKYLKTMENINHICAVDVDENVMYQCQYEARPKPFHYATGYSHKLTVDLFVGSIAEIDQRILDADAVICIELVEHLYADTLRQVPITIFKHVQPVIAVFTTPNADFNVLFNLGKGFRHPDHKFEFTRLEFENWCEDIIKEFPMYSYYIEGIGTGPPGSEHLGCCSQIAVFHKKYDLLENTEKVCAGNAYKLFESYEYPFIVDKRSEEQIFVENLLYEINNSMGSKIFQDYFDDSIFDIPLDYLMRRLKKWCDSKEVLIQKLKDNGYSLKETNNKEYFVHVEQCRSDESEDDYEDSDITVENAVAAQINNEDDWEILAT